MSQSDDFEHSSVIEYSLSELGFIFVFVLLLFSGWELHNFQSEKDELDNKRKKDKKELDIAQANKEEITKQLKSAEARIRALQQDMTEEQTEAVDHWVYVDASIKTIASLNSEIEEEKIAAEKLEKRIAALEEELKEEVPDSPLLASLAVEQVGDDGLPLSPEDVGSSKIKPSEPKISRGIEGEKAGEMGFCTYAPPRADSGRLHGKSIRLGTVMIEHDGIRLVDKNFGIENMQVVDIVGEPFDLTQALIALRDWPINQKLSRKEFLGRANIFLEIGNISSEKREECRFGMDYYRPIYGEKVDRIKREVFEAVFFPHVAILQKQWDSLGYGGVSEIDDFEADAAAALIELIESENIAQAIRPEITPAKKIKHVDPEYPRRALKRNREGKATLKYSVSASGFVEDIYVLEENPEDFGFAKAAKNALTQWQYAPKLIDGYPVMEKDMEKTFKFNSE